MEASDHGSVLREPMSATSAATRMPSRRPERPAVAAPKEPRSFGATQTALGIRCGGFQHLDASLARPSESRRVASRIGPVGKAPPQLSRLLKDGAQLAFEGALPGRGRL